MHLLEICFVKEQMQVRKAVGTHGIAKRLPASCKQVGNLVNSLPEAVNMSLRWCHPCSTESMSTPIQKTLHCETTVGGGWADDRGAWGAEGSS